MQSTRKLSLVCEFTVTEHRIIYDRASRNRKTADCNCIALLYSSSRKVGWVNVEITLELEATETPADMFRINERN